MCGNIIIHAAGTFDLGNDGGAWMLLKQMAEGCRWQAPVSWYLTL